MRLGSNTSSTSASRRPKSHCSWSHYQLILCYLILSTLFTALVCDTADDDKEVLSGSIIDCADGQFRCASNDKCIQASWRCDQDEDCKDGSDEWNCATPVCAANKFQCRITKNCIPRGWRCDHDHDCGATSQEMDTSDEEDCGFSELRCSDNEYKCDDNYTCIKLSKVCDGVSQCPGKDDEKKCPVSLNGTACDPRTFPCEVGCKMTQFGPRCYCQDGYKPSAFKCIDANECEDLGRCDQLCSNTNGSFECSCVSGYTLDDSNRCRGINVPESRPTYLLGGTRGRVMYMHINGSDAASTQTSEQGQGGTNIHTWAIDYNYRNGTACWIHFTKYSGVFQCAQLNLLADVWIVPVPFPLKKVQQIAYDWLSGNWYFLDDRMIFVCNASLTICHIFIDTNIIKPKSVALDPRDGYLFFTDWNPHSAKIERIDLDGYSRSRNVIVAERINSPCSITLDYANRHVYWADAYFAIIFRSNYNGDNRITIVELPQLKTINSLSYFERYLYADIKGSERLISIDTLKGSAMSNRRSHWNDTAGLVSVIKEGITVYAHKVVHAQRQPVPESGSGGSGSCLNDSNGGCEQLCYSMPVDSNRSRCGCQSGFVPHPYNGTCVCK